MDIQTVRDMRSFLAAWSGESARRRRLFYGMAAEGMETCASLSRSPSDVRRYTLLAKMARRKMKGIRDDT